MEIIEEKIKEKYKSKAEFSNKIGVNPKDLSSKIRTIYNKITLVNNFLEYLDLKVEIAKK